MFIFSIHSTKIKSCMETSMSCLSLQHDRPDINKYEFIVCCNSNNIKT